MITPVTVLKFGSSILATEDMLPRAVHEIYRYVRQGHNVVVVVSAFAGETDRLLKHARKYGESADPSATAALVSLGESHSVALLGLALDQAGIPTNILSDRLNRLLDHQVVTRASADGVSKHLAYQLTAKGRALLPVLRAMRDWGLE